MPAAAGRGKGLHRAPEPQSGARPGPSSLSPVRSGLRLSPTGGGGGGEGQVVSSASSELKNEIENILPGHLEQFR